MTDGRIVRTLDLPPGERRLFSSGRFIVSAHRESPEEGRERPAAGGQGWARRVRLERLDPLDGGRLPLGDYAGEARVSAAGEGRLAVVEPTGDLSVLPWSDRLLVLVGRAETADEQRQLERVGAIAPLPGMPGREMPQLVTGSLWAVDAASGDMLWPVPATILRHSLQPHAGTQLPVLLFARMIQSAREPDGHKLSVLCIDKRTGQAVYADDRFNGRSAAPPGMGVHGCGLSGDPDTHTIALSQGRRDAADVQLEFTGAPTAPRPPFQASPRSASAPDPIGDIQYWINKALTLPLPF
ncbi:MAG: hypothetical protein EBX36_03160 [Planctomycetia bacterium]|nr:hypothetical protein [Planctomycetia bacterium]